MRCNTFFISFVYTFLPFEVKLIFKYLGEP